MKALRNVKMLGGFALLSLTLIGSVPASAEVAQRSVYRNAAPVRVGTESSAEFAAICNEARTSKVTDVASDAKPALALREFNTRYLSNEFNTRYLSNEFNTHYLSKEFNWSILSRTTE